MPGTEFAYDFCARIGPLQLGVVLVDYIILSDNYSLSCHILESGSFIDDLVSRYFDNRYIAF